MKALAQLPQDDGPRPAIVRLGQVMAVAVVYYAAARLGLLLQLPGTNASPVWPPSGIGFAAVLFFGLRVWPGIAIGAFLANLFTLPHTMAGVLAASSIGVGNTLEQVVAWLLIRCLVTFPSPFDRARDVFWFVVTATVSCAVASSLGATSLWLSGIMPAEMWGRVWFTWWLGDTAGMLVLTPALYCWWQTPRLGLTPARTLELAALLALTVLTAHFLFAGWIASEVIASLPYLVVPTLLWAAFRFGQRETATLAVLLSVIAIGYSWWWMSHPAGLAAPRTIYAPFLSPAISANDSLLMLQIFVCAVAVTAVTLAAAVSERAQAEQRFRTIFEQAAVGVALIQTGTGRFVRINQRYCELVGYSVDEMTSTNFQTITHPGDLQADLDKMRRLVAGEIGEFTLEKRYYRKDGSVVWVNLTVSPTWRPGDKAEHHIAIVEDISERKEAEAALRASEERLRLAQQAAHIGAFEWNIRTGVNIWTPELEAMYGLQPGEFGRSQPAWESLVHPEDRAGAVQCVAQAFETGLPTGGEWRSIWPDGSAHWIAGRFQAFQDETGQLSRLTGVNIDITEQKRAEEHIRLVVEAAPNGMVMIDQDGKIVLVNAQMEKLFGYRKAELLGQPIEMLVPENYRVQHPLHRMAFFAAPGVRMMGAGRDLYGRCKDGSEVPVEIGLNPIQTEDGPLVLASVIDITERKRAEQQLKSTLDQLQGLTAHLESVREEERIRIARELHDELGQALTGLKLELAWVRSRLNKQTPHEGVSVLLTKTEEMSALIDATIHTMRRIVTELRPGVLDEFGLSAALEWQGQEFHRRTGIGCTVAVGDKALDRDCSSALFRIVQEALTNVARHSRATHVHVRLQEELQCLSLVIHDNGKGMSDQDLSSRQSFGLLGMRERAVAAGGTFQVVSGAGQGTRIMVHIPLPASQTPTSTPAPNRAETLP